MGNIFFLFLGGGGCVLLGDALLLCKRICEDLGGSGLSADSSVTQCCSQSAASTAQQPMERGLLESQDCLFKLPEHFNVL